MSNSLIRILTGAVLMVRSIGHTLGLFPLLYWNGFPNMGSKAGAWVVAVVPLIALLWAHWPAPAMVGA